MRGCTHSTSLRLQSRYVCAAVQQLALITDLLGNFSAEQIRKTRNAKVTSEFGFGCRSIHVSLEELFFVVFFFIIIVIFLCCRHVRTCVQCRKQRSDTSTTTFQPQTFRYATTVRRAGLLCYLMRVSLRAKAIDLMEKMLKMDPDERITVEQALEVAIWRKFRTNPGPRDRGLLYLFCGVCVGMKMF